MRPGAALLLRLERFCAGLGELSPADRAAVAEAIASWRGGRELEAAFGLAAAAGERKAQTEMAIHERNLMLRVAAARFLPRLPAAEQARRLHVEMARYAASGWRRERAADDCPDRHAGRLTEYLWYALRARDRVLSERQIRDVLAVS